MLDELESTFAPVQLFPDELNLLRERITKIREQAKPSAQRNCNSDFLLRGPRPNRFELIADHAFALHQFVIGL